MMRPVGWLIGLLLITLSSCSPKLFGGMAKQGKVEIDRRELFPLLDGCDSSLVLDTWIDFKKNRFSGQLIVAPTDSANTYQLVFLSDLGLSFFDFEVGEKTFVVNHCIEPLQRKAVLSIFEQDFRTLLMLDVPQRFRATKYAGDGVVGYKAPTSDGKCCYLTDPRKRQWLAANKKGIITALDIRLSEYEELGFPKIEMEHPKIGLKLLMEKMKEE